MSRYYSEYVNHMVRVYLTVEEPEDCRTEVDKQNWLIVGEVVGELDRATWDVVRDIYGDGVSLAHAVKRKAIQMSVDEELLWKVLAKFTQRVAVERRLV